MKTKPNRAISSCLVLVACLISGCSKPDPSLTLTKSIGIITVGDVYSEIIAKGTSIPVTYSESFGNAQDGQQAVEITVSQKDQSGVEAICTVVIDELPPKVENGLNIVVTIKVDRDKNMKVKATVSETGYVKEYGPYPVE